MARTADYYALLGVDPQADPNVLKKAFRKLAQTCHPDVPGGSTARMIAVNQAWAVLRDTEARATYDRQREAAIRKAELPASDDAPRPRSSPGPLARRRNARESATTILDFGRYAGWSIAQLVRHDPDYLAWLATAPAGRALATEIGQVLRGS